MIELFKALDAAAALYSVSSEISAPNSKKPIWSRPLDHSIAGPVVEAIEEVPAIHTLTRLRQLSLGSSEAKPLYPLLLASALVKRTHVLGSAEKAIEELESLVATNIGHARIVMVLAAVRTPVAVEVAPQVQLVPFDDLQPPPWIKDFSEESSWPLSRTFEPVAPSAALVMRVPFSPLFTADDKIESKFPEHEVDQLRRIAYCIALAAGGSSAILKIWYEDDDPRFPLVSSGVSYSDPRWGNGAVAAYDINLEQVRTIYWNYENFRGVRKPIDIAMLRLAEAWGGWHREERVIDLGIALEAILMYMPGQTEDNNEISYKLGIRASWLVGKSPSDRLSIYRKIRRLYRFRSQAVHSGSVKTKPDTWKALDEELNAGIALAREIIVAILMLGDWPNWDELVLGAPLGSLT